MNKPNLFIVGAPKSGTTSLYAYLESHPNVFMSPVKEPFYFSPDVEGSLRRPYHYPDDEAAYLALYDEATDQRYRGEASTNYLVSHQAAGLVHDFSPDSKIIAMLRNPVDLMYALHNERVSNGAEPIIDFGEAVKAEDDRRAGRRLPEHFNSLGAVYADNAKLGEQLKRWLDEFGRERVHVIVFGDFGRDTPGEFKRVLEFLDIDPSYKPDSFEARNSSNRRRAGAVRKMVDSGPAQAMRHRVLPAVVGEKTTYRLAKRFSRSRFNRRAYQRPPLPPELYDQLKQSFKPDVALLSELIGRDLNAEWFNS